MTNGKKLSEVCYEHNDGEYYTILTLDGWVTTYFVDDLAGLLPIHHLFSTQSH